MSNMINPFTDWGFKRLFGREESKPVMIDLCISSYFSFIIWERNNAGYGIN